ncbi:MAG TPA: type II secretion system major pseudopilin GspG [Methylobacter sp.]|jgi:general secretion pathway protein G
MKQILRFKAQGERHKVKKSCAFRPSPFTLRLRGFTLLELLVVLGIIAMLAGIVGPQVMKHMGESKTKAAKVQIEDLAAALDMYKLDLGGYPSSEQGLKALIESPDSAKRWNGPYLRKAKMPLDPWQQEYHYVSPGEHGKFDLYTLGADGKEGGEGEDKDIVSWE